ncbi:hypothetical protein [Calycomorphotria hydatis]|uniref:Uncharacterized protein n=1 Tax=Calycomorphotria hydatis TaxID=2528027 RepID=A0A517TFE1_9PLAN|nr:hypothetical protein [Calycomorphotria hydatis]QDT67078.1 hypothetical protein V22_43510 [Calycomorphotria hydatis]
MNSTIETRIERLQNSAMDFANDVEQWQVDHELAMICYDVEEKLAVGLCIYGIVNDLDEAYRLAVAEGELEYLESFDETMLTIFGWWLRPCDKLIREINYLQDKGHTIERADEFITATREVRGILTPDDQFFTGKTLTELCDQAIDDHQAGKTEGF